MKNTFYYITLGILSFSIFDTAQASPIALGLPIDCEINKVCFIQNYVDQDPSDGWKDYRCNNLSYNKHKGTDFAVRSQHLHKSPVKVLAAADGVVLGKRNFMKDIHAKHMEEAYIKDKECGNGITLQHKNDWQTQYCHMKQNSVRFKAGDKIKKGDVLGYVGLSGQTTFPHLHFSVRHKGKPIDPFNKNEMESGCKISSTTLWDNNTERKLTYPDTAIVDFGIKNNLPADSISARSGEYYKEAFSNKTREALIWVEILRPVKGDHIKFTLTSSDNKKKEFSVNITKTQARLFQYVGTKSLPKPQNMDDNYSYTITYELKRGKNVLDIRTFKTKLKNN